jgi:hypothetical protein
LHEKIREQQGKINGREGGKKGVEGEGGRNNGGRKPKGSGTENGEGFSGTVSVEKASQLSPAASLIRDSTSL